MPAQNRDRSLGQNFPRDLPLRSVFPSCPRRAAAFTRQPIVFMDSASGLLHFRFLLLHDFKNGIEAQRKIKPGKEWMMIHVQNQPSPFFLSHRRPPRSSTAPSRTESPTLVRTKSAAIAMAHRKYRWKEYPNATAPISGASSSVQSRITRTRFIVQSLWASSCLSRTAFHDRRAEDSLAEGIEKLRGGTPRWTRTSMAGTTRFTAGIVLPAPWRARA